MENSTFKQYVTMSIDGQLFGIPVLTVQDVLRRQSITKVPLANPSVLGLINLRGRIVTAIDIRTILQLTPIDNAAKVMHVVVENSNEMYSLIVDSVGDVLNLPTDDIESNPANLAENWKNFSLGVSRLKDEILILLDIEKILEI